MLVILYVTALVATPTFASDQEFEDLVSSLERQRGLQHDHIPLVGISSLWARVTTHGRVRGIQVASFENVGPALTPETLNTVLQTALTSRWHFVLRSQEQGSGATTLVYARLAGDRSSLLIAELEDSALSLVQADLSEKEIFAWTKDPEGSLKKRRTHHDF
jgi:hypothetical protein